MGTPVKDIKIPNDAPTQLFIEKHSSYIYGYESKKNDYEYIMTEYLRMGGIYWCLTTMALLDKLEMMNEEEIITFVKSCQHDSGGFGASIDHDPHLLHTLSAVQILVLYDKLDAVDVNGILSFVSGLQQIDGSFIGDKWGEKDSRFSFCALACLSLLGKLDAVDVDKAVSFIVSCMNFDGGFGCVPGSESHSGQVYCCVGALAITNSLHYVNADLLGWWLCERQLPSGGLNGRPEKLPDVCYSWWVLSSLKIIGKLHWIDKDKLCRFILASQDEETGGFADRPGDMELCVVKLARLLGAPCLFGILRKILLQLALYRVDPFHTLFGIAGLSLLQHDTENIKAIDPVYCLPSSVIQRIGIKHDLL